MAGFPMAFVSADATVGEDVQIGPYSVVEPGAVIGDGCRLAARVTIKSGVRLGRENILEEGVVVGGRPQHIMQIDQPGTVTIGDRNVLRENVTVHRAMKPNGVTRVGSDCLLMVGAHVAHDCRVGDHVILTNNVMLGGHVAVGDRACLGGGVAVHQFCRVGRLAMIGGMARIAQDVPPFTMVDGDSNLLVGLNRVGLRRNGVTPETVTELKAAYRTFYRSGLSFEERLTELERQFSSPPVEEFAQFFRDSKRGYLRERRAPASGGIRPIHEEVAERDETARPIRIRKVG